MSPDPEYKNDQLPLSAISALNDGKIIEAIKIVRKENMVDLKDAKDIVDQYIKAHPDLQHQIEKYQAESSQPGVMWIVIIIIVISCLFVFVF